MSRRAFLITLFLTVAAGFIFARWPQLDLAATRALQVEGGFIGSGNAARMLRSIFYWLPATIMGFMVLIWIARLTGVRVPSHLCPKSKSLIFLSVALLTGPGAVVNLGLKEHSGRPRPTQVRDFGGTAEFRPWNTFDGTCRSNCSFVSGEVAASAWLMAPASLAPPQVRTAAVAGALIFTAATAVLRMAFGAHFLSDVIFAALITLLICQALRLWVTPAVKRDDEAGP